MQIIEMRTADLIEYENNPRINDLAVEKVAESIREFGFKVPIVVDSRNVIIAGHTRLRAAESLGLDKVPVIVADDLTDGQVKAFRLADNKTGEFAEWDFEKLDEEMEELALMDFDMSLFGFKESQQIDWAGVEDLTEDVYEEPKKQYLQCPHCQHIDTTTHFKKVER